MDKTKVSILIEKDGKFYIKQLTHRQVRDIYDIGYVDTITDYDVAHKTFAEIVDYIDDGLAFGMKDGKVVKSKAKVWHSRRKPRWKQIRRLKQK